MDWKERANLRRDTRQTKVVDIRRPSGSKKNTKKWCRGKEGRPHQPVCVDYSEIKNMQSTKYNQGWKVLVCSECKRELDFWWPSTFLKQTKEPPAWVTDKAISDFTPVCDQTGMSEKLRKE